MTPQATMLATIVVPLAASVLITRAGRWPNLREAISVLTTLALFALVVSLLPSVLAGHRPALQLFRVLPGISLGFRLEPLGMLFALVASGLWIATAIYSIGYMRAEHESHQTRFYAFFPLALASAMGIAFASNLFTLFVFYEALTLSTYPLVIHRETPEARRAGRVYLGLLMGTSIGLLLLAIVWTWAIAGTLSFQPGGILAGRVRHAVVPVLLGLYLFGIGKAALMPFHRWLPSAMVAPTPVSALLHAVAVVKAGVFTVLKVVIYVFGTHLLTQTGASVWLMYVAGFTLVTASLVAMLQDDLKARLAYSTVSQLSYIVLGATLATRWGIIGGSLHLVMHAFAKITLFFCAGAIAVTTHKTRVSELNGIGRRMPVTMLAFLLGTLSIIGLPPGGGAWSKWLLAMGTIEAHRYLLLAALMLSSLLNIGYLMTIVARAFFLAPGDGGDVAGVREAPLLCLVPLSITALGCVVLFFYAQPIVHMLMPLVNATGSGG
ncbi:MAG TPA: monovalent cation/H+ antiporter subunit D family protein [Gammaproteobacteria bacterium]|nr:monovalent cation/H+ antiporter subunit D family protein [Gammaproteobacteria bacterium]